jgi:NitT/TauT family transport system ATP-binding protein
MQRLCINCRGIGKQFCNRWVLRGVDVSCSRGECLAILGPSGSGKTTLLNIISGLYACDCGDLQVSARRLGYVFQEPRLLPWKSVLQNVTFVMEHQHQSTAERLATALLAELGLADALQSYPRELSGGMKQRVSIARAFAHDPEAILMDEPFSGLDLQLKEQILQDLTGLLREYEPALLYVSHDPMEAALLADRALVISADGAQNSSLVLDRPREDRDDGYLIGAARRLGRMIKGEEQPQAPEPEPAPVHRNESQSRILE